MPPKREILLGEDTTFVVGVPWVDSFRAPNSPGWARSWPGCGPMVIMNILREKRVGLATISRIVHRFRVRRNGDQSLGNKERDDFMYNPHQSQFG